MQLSEEVKRLLLRLGETPENLTGRIIFKNVWQMLDSYLCMQEDLEEDNGHFLVLVQRRSGILSGEDSPQCEWDNMAESVEGLYPTPHIHEQMTAYIMATSTATLSTTR